MPPTTRPFRFGVVAAFARDTQEWIAKARRAEVLGYATLLVPDGLRHTLAPLPALAVAAAATSSLRLGTYVLANDLRHPVLLAKDAASLDLLSGGRFELGIGAGRPTAAEDYRMLGLTFDAGAARVARLADSLGLLKGLLAGQRVVATGPNYTFGEAEVSPRPLQQPHPPILVAGSGSRLLALAAREADIIALGLPPDATEATAAEKIEHLRRAAGARFEQLELNVNLMAVADQVPRYVSSQLGLTADALARSGAVSAAVGTTEEMCETLLRRRDRLGISYIAVADELMEALAPVVERLAGH
ncbi:MAG TPA: TIGR03621 family F420-dependent LLM class oxidoreductase [Chloroflexota bacterium]|nr:TIGR03621 family F420-dependent LLM class oxidoreductase [Chloroflexota bacterium]